MRPLDILRPGWDAATTARITFRALTYSIRRGDTRFTTGEFPSSTLANATFDFDEVWNEYQRLRGYVRGRTR